MERILVDAKRAQHNVIEIRVHRKIAIQNGMIEWKTLESETSKRSRFTVICVRLWCDDYIPWWFFLLQMFLFFIA